MQKANYFNMLRLKEIITTDIVTAEDIYGDHNWTHNLVILNFSLKIFKLMVYIFNISYFLGFFWYIFCDEMLPTDIENESNYFITNFDVDERHEETDRSNSETGILLVYYMFTSLSTVGFGDFHPRSNAERFFCSIILLFGVAIFSYVMATFTDILTEYNDLNADLDQGDRLTQFFGLLQIFNEDCPLSSDLISKIEDFFHYKWAQDTNQAMSLEQEVYMLNQLPDHVLISLYTKFLFREFMSTFVETF